MECFKFECDSVYFHTNQLHTPCHLPKEVTEYFSKQLNNVKGKYKKHVEDEFYTANYDPGEVVLDWSKECIQSMEPITVSTEAIIEWKKWFSAQNQYVDYCNVKWMKNFDHHVDE